MPTPNKITPEERNVGKTCDLAFGYAGGVNAFRKFSDQFSDDEVKQFNKDWRAAHPNIKQLWYRLDKAAWTAVAERGRVVRCGVIRFQCDGTFTVITTQHTCAVPWKRLPGRIVANRWPFRWSTLPSSPKILQNQSECGATLVRS
ncbi:MAG TPA: hypothetical protein VKB89_04410 [Xanthobacteraceae bacterium]|nr:hypothetical protein [Xanthobacteraceae bacterium]